MEFRKRNIQVSIGGGRKMYERTGYVIAVKDLNNYFKNTKDMTYDINQAKVFNSDHSAKVFIRSNDISKRDVDIIPVRTYFKVRRNFE